MNDDLETMLADGLRHRAAAAGRPGRGFNDVRRRYRRRRQQQVAIGLVPAVAGLGWVITRPLADAPLRPSGDGVVDCGESTVPPTNFTLSPTSSTTTAIFGSDVPESTVALSTNPGDGLITTTTTIPTLPGQRTGEQTYVVQSGDNLSRIANIYRIEAEAIATANGWGDGTAHRIFPGDIIQIPAGGIVPWPTTSLVAVEGTVSDPVGASATSTTAVAGTTPESVVGSQPMPTSTTICLPPGTGASTSVAPATSEAAAALVATTVAAVGDFGDFTSTMVQVANCSAQNGVARMMSSILTDVGFRLAEPVNGMCDPKLEASYVVYDEGVPGAQAVAETVAGVLGGLMVEPAVLPIKTESGAWADGSGVVLYLGNDVAGKTLDEIQSLPESSTNTTIPAP